MTRMGLEVPQPDVDSLFESWDPSGGGTLDFKELQKALRGEGAAVNAVAEEGWGLTKRLREVERAAKIFSQVVARLPELVGLSADLVGAALKDDKGGGGKGDKKRSLVATSDADNKPAKVEEVGKVTAKGEKVTRVCLDTVLDAGMQAYFQLEREEVEDIIAAFHSWDANGDGELQFDEFREMAAYSNPTLPPKSMMKIYQAATPDGEHINVLKFSQVMLENGLTLRKRPPDDCFENGQLKGMPGGNADAAAAALANQGRGKKGWARLGAAHGGSKMSRVSLMMNLGKMMSEGALAEEGGGEAVLSDTTAEEGAERQTVDD